MKMESIVNALLCARDNYRYGYIEVTIPGQEATEIIINESDSLDNKIEYYKKTYNDDGVHRMNEHIRIVSAGGVEQIKLCEY